MAEQHLTRFEELYLPFHEKFEDLVRHDRDFKEELQASSWSHVELERSPVRTPSPMRAPPVKPLKQPKAKAKNPNKREMSLEEKNKFRIAEFASRENGTSGVDHKEEERAFEAGWG
ncbi:hypothetical protein LR48_Vigan10g069800 [Vigna angularis]|uniref:Uncharacterized protein n=1 Tax=Phaseolus angularis TaxID=3914 RepID=A0A0L9VIC1_PHAAN|nr:uncharacterized protein HKW66_Vig0180040 [Vigna angularis]KOM54806.1 hypothetical protein LR48_Vigan10g069800 [Vigna angularis]